MIKTRYFILTILFASL